MKILVTGSSGFIGYHLSKKLLKNKKNLVIGLDNHNNYYSTKIKNLKLKFLKKKNNFKFFKVDISNKKKINHIFRKFRPQIVFHIAGQPGVLYSFKNPLSYRINNINATRNISTISKQYNVEKFIFASSSSIYGDQKNFPIKENFRKKPKNYYAKTKLKCEKDIKKILHLTKTKFMIFRFFTIYGPLGRPDMFIHKLLNSIKKNQKIHLYNNGQNFRDFTYIDDVLKIFQMCLKKLPKNNILNICRSKPIKTIELVKIIEKIYRKHSNKKYLGVIKGEMFKTHGSNKLLKKNFKNIKFTSVENGLKRTVSIFKKTGY